MRNYLTRTDRNDYFDFFDSAFEDFFSPVFKTASIDNMKTDIKETDNSYIMDVELAGYNKEDISLNIDNGYLTISAEKNDKNEHGKEGSPRFLRRERTTKVSRSYYVGDEISEDEIKAKFNSGLLTITVPKQKEKIVQPKKIMID